jgi:hypothetical protein
MHDNISHDSLRKKHQQAVKVKIAFSRTASPQSPLCPYRYVIVGHPDYRCIIIHQNRYLPFGFFLYYFKLGLAEGFDFAFFFLTVRIGIGVDDDEENVTELGASAYWKTKCLSITGGANLYIAKIGTNVSLRFAPTAYLHDDWQIGLQMIYYTKNIPLRELYGTPVYGCLSVNKQFGKRWNLGIDWHDMFDAVCSQAEVNRHAANIKLQYRFE